MSNPFREHRTRELAKKQASKQAADGLTGESAQREMTEHDIARKTLTELTLRLKEIRSTEAKAEFKREHLVDLFPYAEGVMNAELNDDETLPQDDVFMTILLWAFDASLLRTGREMAAFANQQGWHMPPPLQIKDPAIFIMTRLTDIAAEHESAPEKMPHDLIIEISQSYKDADLHDDLGFKVQKMLGDLKAQDDPELALQHYQAAAKIKPNRNGLVKKMSALTDRISSKMDLEPTSSE